MFRMMLILLSVMLCCEHVVTDYFGTVVTVNDNTEYSKEDFENFDTTTTNWTIEGLKLLETNEGEHFLEPVVSMTGNEWGIISTNILLPGDCPQMARLGISFRLYISGYNKTDTDDDYYPTNPGLKLSLTNQHSSNGTELLLTDLSRMNVVNGVWVKYQVEIMITMGRMYLLKMKMMKGMTGQSDIFVDDLSLNFAPVLTVADDTNGLAAVDNNCSDKVEPTTTTTSPETTTTEEVIGTNSTTQKPSVAVNVTNIPENMTSINETTTTTSTVNNKTDAPEVTETTSIINNTSSGGNATEVGLKADSSSNNALLYGYAGEVVLICLTVLFLILFVLMAVKYHRLKTRFGGYDVDIGGAGGRESGQNNPAYDVQMNYR